MPNKLERSLERCDYDAILKSVRALTAAGMSIDEVDVFLSELSGWLWMAEHPSPDIFEGDKGWYRLFSTFVIEGDAGKTCPSRILRKNSWRPKSGAVDLDRPETWKKRPASSPPTKPLK